MIAILRPNRGLSGESGWGNLFGSSGSRGSVTHEDFSRTETVKASSDRSFGLVFTALFLLIAFGPLLRAPHQGFRWWAFGVSMVFAVLTLFWTAPLAPLNRLWLRFGLVLHHLVSPLGLGLLFFTTIMPIGLLMRAMGRDPMRLRREPEAKSYWIKREPPKPAAESMENQSMENQF